MLPAALLQGQPEQPVAAAANPMVTPLQAGADVIEVGVPSAHPSADGPTIQAADARALQAGADREQVGEGWACGCAQAQQRCVGGRRQDKLAARRLKALVCVWLQVFSLVRQASMLVRAPLLLFAYHAELLGGGGPETFCRLASEAGAAGEMLPDPGTAVLLAQLCPACTPAASCQASCVHELVAGLLQSSVLALLLQVCWSPTFLRSSCLRCSMQQQRMGWSWCCW